MRYFKILNEDGSLAVFGKNDIIGEEITEEEYNSLYAEHCPPQTNTVREKAQAWDVLMGVSE